MTTAAELVQAIQPLTSLSDRSLKSALLSIFESGVIEAGPAGRAALQRGPKDAAAIAVGLLAAPSTLQAGRYANGILRARRQQGSIIDPHEILHKHELGKLAEIALSQPRFWGALTVLIRKWQILDDGLRHYATLPNQRGFPGEWKTSLLVSLLSVPSFGARLEIEVKKVQPLNRAGFNSREMFFAMDAFWLGESTTTIEQVVDAETSETSALLSNQGFDHRVIITLGASLHRDSAPKRRVA
jgi:hypothetical protein